MAAASGIPGSFVLGVLTPLTAVCVLPLYPGFLSFLSRQLEGDESRTVYALFGLIVVSGVLGFMVLTGLVFTTFLELSLTGVIGTVSPVAFAVLGVMSVLLILDIDFTSWLPSTSAPQFENPLANAFGFGFFFGAIVIPCNPGLIAAFFARSLLFESPLVNLFNFAAFGLGIGFPLLVFSLVSSRWSSRVIDFLKRHETLINRGTGLVMLAISIYYLVFVFNVVGLK